MVIRLPIDETLDGKNLVGTVGGETNDTSSLRALLVGSEDEDIFEW